MNLSDQFAADTGNTQAPVSLSQQFAADAAAGAKVASANAVPPALRAPQLPQQASAPGTFMSALTGFGKGVGNTALGIEQLAGKGIGAIGNMFAPASNLSGLISGQQPQNWAQRAGDYLANDAASGLNQIKSGAAAAEAAHPFATGAGNIVGNVMATAPLAMMAPEVGGMGLLGRATTGAALGAANGAISPVENPGNNFWQQKAGQIGLNAAVGGAATPLMAGLGSAVQGVTDPIRQRLAAAGVTMTPGQIAGGSWQRLEDKLTSVPVLGDFIKNAQQRSVQSFNRAAYQGALEPIGAHLPQNVGAGSEGVGYVRNQIGNVYNSIEPRAQFVADQNFGNDVAQIRNTLGQMAPGAVPQFDNIVQNQITGKLNNGAMTGAQWGDTRSMIDRIGRAQIRGDASADQLALHDALNDLNAAVNAGVGRASPPDILPTLGRANAAYAQYKQLERAAGSVGASNNGNVFTAAQYANGARNGATAFQKATNSGLNGQFSADATNVLGSKYPDSGTVGRSLLTLGLGALAGHSVAPGAVIPGAIGIGAASLPYTALGQRLTQGLLMNRPAVAQPIGNAISRFAPLMPGLLGPLTQ
ncbi:hypothetical protein QZM97_26245 [Burkholderia orbicola]|uniref:hypothetical protein n=1 Tax=Burkholderia orbicola TaxID=2978683 RepID=UPI00264CFDDD|nr:hypothetical protein [Burkholderia orbicola]MDN7993584.1 hypothetical protein [Burkholderia orbicola]